MSPRSTRSNRFRSPAPNTRALTLNWSAFMESVVEDEEMIDNNDISVNFIEEDSDSIEGEAKQKSSQFYGIIRHLILHAASQRT